MRRVVAFLFLLSVFFRSFAGEGMWLPLLLDSLNYKDMQEKGLKLEPGEIYNTVKPALKDAIVIFGGGCTGEVISPEGLVITNHHCGYSRIQAHSTVEKNYLADGYWAASQKEELPNPGLTVTFLVRMEDVTSRILKDTDEKLSETERSRKIALNIHDLVAETKGNSHYHVEVKSVYFGKQYYMYVYEIFRDVRLVGTPPEAIGNFGGDSDNWIWPRHTGDFSLFRIYADKNNKPADYSPDNVPYKPAKYLNISVGGVKEGDFTMILGYPGRTDQYLFSDHLDLIAKQTLPAKIEMRTARLDVIKEIMERGPEYKLHYANKHRNISNSWKKWIGVTKGVERADVISRKKDMEKEFAVWAGQHKGYELVLDEFRALFSQYSEIYKIDDLGSELLSSMELNPLADRTQGRIFSMGDSSANGKKRVKEDLKKYGSRFFKTNAIEIDGRVLPKLLAIYETYSDKDRLPSFYSGIHTRYNGNYEAFVANILKNSMFSDSIRYFKTLSKSDKAIGKAIMNDPLMVIYRDFSGVMLANDAGRKLDSLDNRMRSLYRQYVTGLMNMYQGKIFYPDANFTMRVTYGNVQGYQPQDAVKFTYYSTLDGVMEKEDPEITDYKVPAKLKELHASNDFGTYLQNGKVPVCFIASNHTSGGNSGSPVLNANGNLIGINFDRNWEGTVSDYAYDPRVCRNISLDIRYVLYVIDKLADADWILNELTLTNN